VLAASIINNLSFHQPHRGKLVQQGAIRILVRIFDAAKQYSENSEKDSTQLNAAHALARNLVMTNPAIYFTGEAGPMLPASVKVLKWLLEYEPPPDTPRDWLPTYEALMSLTNLASLDNFEFKDSLAASIFEKIEDLLFCPNLGVQSRATELLCNLCYTPTVVRAYSPNMATQEQSSKRLTVLVALATAEQRATRLAALGGLCMLSEADDGVVRTLTVLSEKSQRMISRVLDPTPEDLKFGFSADEQNRVAYLLGTILNMDDKEIRAKAFEELQLSGVIKEKLEVLAKRSDDGNLKEMLNGSVIPALKAGTDPR